MGYFENENFYTTDAQIARYVDTVYFDRKECYGRYGLCFKRDKDVGEEDGRIFILKKMEKLFVNSFILDFKRYEDILGRWNKGL